MLTSDPRVREAALEALEERGDPDVVPALIQALRFVPDKGAINATLVALVGERPGTTWHDWMLWQEAHPEIEPFVGFDAYKADVMARIDENFRLFLRPGVKHDIRLEEIAWGGVRKDGIPALINPTPHPRGGGRIPRRRRTGIRRRDQWRGPCLSFAYSRLA